MREAAKRLAEELKDEARIAPQAVTNLHASSSGRAPAPASPVILMATDAPLHLLFTDLLSKMAHPCGGIHGSPHRSACAPMQ